MNRSPLRTLFCSLFLLVCIQEGAAQHTSDDRKSGQEDLKIGLVLSGGGAKGIAHIGVLEALEEAGIQVDYIAGTSMGSIVAAFYSIGYTPQQMTEMALATDWEQLFTDRPGRRLLSMFEKQTDERTILSFPITARGVHLPSGLIAGQSIMSWLSFHIWPWLPVEDFSQLPIPFATVATDIETGQAVVFRSGYLPDALRASISFPSAFVPYQLNDQELIDGGLSRNLPVQEVLDMGADYVIAIDVTSPLRPSDQLDSVIMVMTQAVNYRVREKTEEQKQLADLVINLNELDPYQITDFDHAEEFIRIGRETTRSLHELLQEVPSRQKPMEEEEEEEELQMPQTEHSRIRIGSVSVTGNRNISEDLILSELRVLENETVAVEEIQQVIDHLYSTRFFLLVTYRLQKIAAGTYHLELRVTENTEDNLKVGLRYESRTQASLLMQTSFRNLFHRGSNFRLTFRLGRELDLLSEYMLLGDTSSRFGLKASFGYQRDQVSYYSGEDPISSHNHHLLRADLFAGSLLNRNWLIGAGIRKDFLYFTNEINLENIPFSGIDHHAVYGQIWLDTFNRRSFPTHGQQLLLQATFSDEILRSPVNFNEQRLTWKGVHPVSSSLSLRHTIYLGRSNGSDLPWSYWFTPNRNLEMSGVIRFGGYERYELSGRNIRMASVGFQLEILRQRFLRADFYAGDLEEEWSFDPGQGRTLTGFSLSAGALTILGPLELIVSGSARNPLLYELQFGYNF